MKRNRVLYGIAFAVIANTLSVSAALGQTCADMDGDGVREVCGPEKEEGSNSGSDQDASNRWQELARIKQERYEYAQSQNASGEQQMAAGDLNGAIASFKEAKRYHGGSRIRRNLAFAEGLLAARNRDYATALSKFRQAISLDTKDSGPVRAAMYNAGAQANADGIKRYYAGDYVGALSLFKAALALAPNASEVRYNIAVTEAQLAASKGSFGAAAKKLAEAGRQHLLQTPAIALETERQAISRRAVAAAAAALERGDKRGAQRGYRDAVALGLTCADLDGDGVTETCGPPRVGNAPSGSNPSLASGVQATTPSGQSTHSGPSQSASNSASASLKPAPAVHGSDSSQKPTVPVTSPSAPGLPWKSSDFAPPSSAAHSACMLGTTASQNAVRRGEIDFAARVLRQVIPGCRGAATRRLLQFRLDEIDREIAERKKRAGYKPVATGLIGGTGWVFEDVYRDVATNLSPEDREEANSHLNDRFTAAGIDAGTYMAAKDYEFILGLAVSDFEGLDLTLRVLRDNDSDGEFSRHTREQYGLLSGNHFDVLDCHSNGAMICLAALKNGDATARKVRLFGPQLSPDAVVEWRRLLGKGGLGNKIETLQIVIADGDPVPAASYLYSSPFRNEDTEFRETLFGQALDRVLQAPECEMEGLSGCYDLPAPQVIRVPCKGRIFPLSISECHPFSAYKRELDVKEAR